MAFSPQALIKGVVSRILPNATVDGPESEGAPRLMRYRELGVSLLGSTKHPHAHEGSYFLIPNPTEGTGVAGAVLAAFANTTAAFVIQNTADPSAPGAKSIDLDFFKLLYTVAPATATAMRYSVAIDDVSRLPSGGFAKIVGSAGTSSANPVGPVINTSIANVWAFTGAAFMTVPAPGSNVRYVAKGGVAGLPVVGTEHLVRFGPDGANSGAGTIDTPVSIPPGKWCVIHIWWPGNATTGPSAEYSLGQIER
jgi:hypothetical protein